MSDLTTTITIDDTDHQINIENTNDTLDKIGYIHYNKEFDVYLLISYKTQGGNVLDHTVHQIGTKPTIHPIPRETFNDTKIRETIENKLNYTLSDDQLDELAERYIVAGVDALHQTNVEHDTLYKYTHTDGTISIDIENPLEGWDIIINNTLEDMDYTDYIDTEHDPIQTILNTLQTYTPGDHEYTARFQTGDIDAWRVRALELYQHSTLANKPQLCKVQALREAGHDYMEISNILETHRSTVSHQLNDIDNWLDRANWTTQNVTSD